MKAYCSLSCIAEVYPAVGRKQLLPLQSTGDTAPVSVTGVRAPSKETFQHLLITIHQGLRALLLGTWEKQSSPPHR